MAVNDPLCYCVVARTQERAARWLSDRGMQLDKTHRYVSTGRSLNMIGLRNIVLVFVDQPKSEEVYKMIVTAMVSQQRGHKEVGGDKSDS